MNILIYVYSTYIDIYLETEKKYSFQWPKAYFSREVTGLSIYMHPLIEPI